MDNNKESLRKKLTILRTELKSSGLLEVRRRKLESEVANIEQQLDEYEVIKKGNVEKLRPKIPRFFQDRYLTLYPTKLQYKDEETSRDSNGEFDLNKIIDVKEITELGWLNDKKKGHFNFVYEGRTYEFRVKNENEAKAWVAAIQTAKTNTPPVGMAKLLRPSLARPENRNALDEVQRRSLEALHNQGHAQTLRELAESLKKKNTNEETIIVNEIR